jgi:hypothetical protein
MSAVSNPTTDLCPICLAPAPRNETGREHLGTHSREELITAIGALGADLEQAIQRVREAGIE